MSLFASAADAAYALVRPIVHATDGEAAHNLTLSALQPLPRARSALTSPVLATELAGLLFPNPVGLAPGFDKDARVAHAMPHFGFGFVEVGTLTPLPQDGNPRPRLFRLVEDGAVINRMGFNNGGQAKAAERIACLRRHGLPVPLGINIGANKDSTDRIADYAKGTAAMAPLADYLTVNISSPNTPGLRALQDKGALEALLDGVAAAQPVGAAKPVFLKVAPDLEPADIDDIVAVAIDKGLAAVIVSNTTITRPALLSRHAEEAGACRVLRSPNWRSSACAISTSRVAAKYRWSPRAASPRPNRRGSASARGPASCRYTLRWSMPGQGLRRGLRMVWKSWRCGTGSRG